MFVFDMIQMKKGFDFAVVPQLLNNVTEGSAKSLVDKEKGKYIETKDVVAYHNILSAVNGQLGAKDAGKKEVEKLLDNFFAKNYEKEYILDSKGNKILNFANVSLAGPNYPITTKGANFLLVLVDANINQPPQGIEFNFSGGELHVVHSK